MHAFPAGSFIYLQAAHLLAGSAPEPSCLIRVIAASRDKFESSLEPRSGNEG